MNYTLPGHDEPAFSDWLEEKGFSWSSDDCMYLSLGFLEIVLAGDVRFYEADVTLSLLWTYPHPMPGGGRQSMHYLISDNPTKGEILRLLDSLGQ